MHSILVLLGVLTVVFFAGRAIGDPALLILGTEATPESIEQLRGNLGLNDPMLVQYGRFILSAATGDMGVSYWQGVPALPLVLGRLPATLLIAGAALLMSIPLAIALGAAAAWLPGSVFDRLTNMVSLAGASIVDFWVALMLIFVVSVQLGWLPTSGFGGLGLSGLPFVILPAITLAIRPLGRLSQVTRSAMIDELSQPYIKMARAKGMPEHRVVARHGLKNGLIPTITLGGDELISMLNGAVVIETVFAWPGIGLLLVQAIERRDLPTIEAIVLVVTVMVVLVNLLVDVAYARLNPKIRYGGDDG